MPLAYPAGRPHLVGGRFVQFGDDGKLAGMALLEMYEGENRLVIGHDASGAPVVDCDGRVAAVVSKCLPRPWCGDPNSNLDGMRNAQRRFLPVQTLDEADLVGPTPIPL
ncbi:hypothetical protein ABIA96_007182 [Bradyrhizobium sp. LB11.1]